MQHIVATSECDMVQPSAEGASHEATGIRYPIRFCRRGVAVGRARATIADARDRLAQQRVAEYR